MAQVELVVPSQELVPGDFLVDYKVTVKHITRKGGNTDIALLPPWSMWGGMLRRPSHMNFKIHREVDGQK